MAAVKPAIQIPEGIHAILSPSKAHMFLACDGALGAAKGQPPQKPSRYAAEGTTYHDVARRALIEDKDCAAYIGDRYQVGPFEFIIDAENADFAQVYVDLVRSLPGKRFVEVDLEYSRLWPGVPKETDATRGEIAQEFMIPVASGTGDNVTIDFENRVIYGVDLKFGRGDVVYAAKNPQVRIYLAAAIAKYDLLGITDDWRAVGIISQPRVQHYDSETLTVGELRAWMAEQTPAANRAYTLWTQGPERVHLSDLTPGEKQCRWCPLEGCKARAQLILDRFPKGHAAAVIPTLTKLDDIEIAHALDVADEVEHWLSAIRSEGLARALQGHVLPNWKLVQGRRGNRALPEDPDTTRVQLDVAALVEIGVEEVEEPTAMPITDALHFALGDAAYQVRKIQTVATLEKPLAKKAPLLWAALQAHITQADGKPALERMEDPRPPLAIVSQEFPTTEPGSPPSLL